MYTHMHEDPPQGPSIAAYKGCSQGMQIECALDNLQFLEHIPMQIGLHIAPTRCF